VDLKYVGIPLLDNEEGCTWRPIPASHKPLHFRGQFLPVSLTRKVLFCTFKFLCIFETLHEVRGGKKKFKFCWPGLSVITRRLPTSAVYSVIGIPVHCANI
jgi:hypothetical protein